MPVAIPLSQLSRARRAAAVADGRLLLLSLALQLTLALFFGHLYDMRIFMATGYLAGTGQNPYVAQDLSAVFHDTSFRGITTLGYPPPWALLLGLVYRATYAIVPNLLAYNLATKLPAIAANIGLAYAVEAVLGRLGAAASTARRAWIFLLFNPLLLYFSAAWGQFDSIVALASLGALVALQAGKTKLSAGLLALALSLKPTALPLAPVAVAYLVTRSHRQAIAYAAVLAAGILLFCVAPFVVLGWSPAPILRGWNAHFTVGGGMSLLTFVELLKDSYRLPGRWWLLGLAWVPALAAGAWALRPGIGGLADLLGKGTALILIFFLTRAWLSEPNVILILPLVVILTAIRALDGRALAAVCVLPLAFTVFNASPPQLLFPSFPGVMRAGLRLAGDYRTVRLMARIVMLVPWQIAGWWIVITCLRRSLAPTDGRLTAWR